MEMKDEIEMKLVQKPKRRLKWYQRQWGAGFLYGVHIGWLLGIATAVIVYGIAEMLAKPIGSAIGIEVP